jgi:hypothetical protein
MTLAEAVPVPLAVRSSWVGQRYGVVLAHQHQER